MNDPTRKSNERFKDFAMEGKALSKAINLDNEEENKKEDSDYDWDFEDEQKDARKKKEILQAIDDKKVVRQIEEQKAKNTYKYTEEGTDSRVRGDPDLDALWLRVRNFLNDINSKGEKREMPKGDEPNRTKFENACKSFDIDEKGAISENNLLRAFTNARLRPTLTIDELKKLCKALEIYLGDEGTDINYRKILATGAREFTSINGIFPRIKSKGPSQKQIEEQKRKEEEERKKQDLLEKEEKKRKELADKRIEMAKKEGAGYKKLTKDEEKMKERENQLKREAELKEIEKKQREETEKVRKEVVEYSRAIEQLQKTVKSSKEDIRKWFKMFDDNEDNFLEIEEFKRLLKYANIVVRDQDLQKVFELMDLQQTGKISYNNFCDVMDKNAIPPIESIVRKRRRDRGEEFIEGLPEEELSKTQNMKTVLGEYSSVQKDLGSIDGLSQIMKRSDVDYHERKLIDDDDVLNIYNEIKEMLRINFLMFDDILQRLGKPSIGKEDKITLNDFETLVRSMPQASKFSSQQIKSVFSNHCYGKSALDGFIPTIEFKDKFFPGKVWQRMDDSRSDTISLGQRSVTASVNESKSESMHVDNIMAGKKYDDIIRERELEQEKILKNKESKYGGFKGGLQTIAEEKFEVASRASHSSIPSKAIDDIMARDQDPRRNKFEPSRITGSKPATANNSLRNESKVPHDYSLRSEDLKKFKGNENYYRQNEVVMSQIPIEDRFVFDKNEDKFLKQFCEKLITEIKTAPGGKVDLNSYVDRYGKTYKGFLTFQEFEEIYQTHVLEYNDKDFKKAQIQGALLRAVFGIFDTQSLGRISQQDFVRIVLQQQPTSMIIDRLKNKVRKGGERLLNVLSEEFQSSDILYGCQGQLPISNFQTIMRDYDLSMVEQDLKELRARAIAIKDIEGNEFVKYQQLLEEVRPKKQVVKELDQLNKLVTRIQALWRGYVSRKHYKNVLKSELKTVGDQFGMVSGKRVQFKDEEKKRGQSQTKKMTAAQKKLEAEKKKKQLLAANKAKRKKGETLDARMGQVIKPSKEKMSEKQLKVREEMTNYIKNVLLDQIITNAQCYGESLIVGREIQQKFENRPVTKYVFPLIHEFQYNVMGVQPKTLQTLNELGQIMYLDSENQLNQYDIPTNKTLQQVNLGTRPPLKHYDIIDMVCDQTSGRIYTLNSNWILEIWNIEQNVSLPQKRLAVCTNEGNKDYISLYYKNNFNNAKPRFLSLSDHNQQILVVNTSCVDGSIVFIDPISFSVLKKIQLRYQDYEIPKRIRETISFLKALFLTIKQKSGKDIADIFNDITDKKTQQIQIRDFAIKLSLLDQTQKLEDIFKMCSVLDQDGNGCITLDEFLHYFQHLELNEDTDFERKKAEEELFENIWPEWLVKEGKIDYAKGLITRMFDSIRKTSDSDPEKDFQVFDTKDKGLISMDNFKKVLSIFFREAKLIDNEVDFILRMTPKTVDQQYMYREFCKFLDKRFVRTFKQNNNNSTVTFSIGQDTSFVGQELDTPVTKEASLNYVIRKCAELNLDLRAIFVKNDENELSVISRAKFWRILENLPLGLLPFELEEIFDNDLHYDNYGNVDYTVIINSDIFVTVERQRIRRNVKKGNDSLRLDDTKMTINPSMDMDKLTDNRKVVVEDLVYIDDLEILVYTTISPRTSTIFVTHTKKNEKQNDQNGVEVITLQGVKSKNKEAHKQEIQQTQQNDLMTNYFQILAKLRGHRNSDPPTLCYIAQSGCLVSGEKHLSEKPYQPNKDSMPKITDPSIPLSHQFQKSSTTAYERHADRESHSKFRSEIIIWNIQRDMIELFQANPPWIIPVYKRFDAHNASIIDICYLSKCQLLVSTSTDQTIRFFDPISVSYELTDPNNIPHAMQRPGYYRPLNKENTKGNVTFKEVKRIYTGTDTSCFSLRCLNISNIHLDQNSDFKSQIEWLVGLKLGRPQWQGRKNTQIGFICGYGIERVKIEVPAIHHDDIVPPYVMKECEDLVETRRRRIRTAFQHQLPHKIEKIYSQVQLQNSYIAQVRKLFLGAILKRKDLKYVNPEPLREIYKIILKLPNRNKFENFLATSGCSDKLSVSETFFYLQKFMQIHPLRTTQIEFEKSIDEFQKKHSREFLRGTKRWPKQAVQKFANFIKANGIDIGFMQRDSLNASKINDFCTRERFIQYFNDVVFQKEKYSDEEIDSIINELDPFFTGIIQVELIQNYYREEIHFHNLTTLNRPKQIFTDIRAKVFPNKKLALQQALTSVDIQGDGYIKKEQFIEAFQKAGIKEDRDVLEFLFEVVAEKYNTNREEGTNSNEDDKVMSITYFINKLFSTVETSELNEIDVILQNIKATLIYKGLDFSIVFAENTVESKGKKNSALDKSGADDTQAAIKKQKDQPVDLTYHFTRFAQQLVASEFCQRVEQLNGKGITQDHIKKLANFLSLNQKNNSVIYLNSWLHHLRRVSTAFHVPDKQILPVICSKLLRNENVFRSYVESTCELKGRREEEKIIEVADLRQVLQRFGVNYINQDIFVNEFTRNEASHIEDLITRMKNCVKQAYNMATSLLNQSSDQSSGKLDVSGQPNAEVIETLRDLRRTDYFDRVQMKLKKLGGRISLTELVDRMRQFDPGEQGRIKIHHFINVLKHNYPQLFDQETLIGLQFELECLNSDDCVDYEEFVKIFLEKQAYQSRDEIPMNEIRLNKGANTYQIQDYEDLLSRISANIKQQGLDMNDLVRIFKIYSKQGGFITYDHLKKIFELIGIILTDVEFKLMVRFADETNDGLISAYEFASQIIYAKEISAQFDVNKWIVASRILQGRMFLLERIDQNFDVIKDLLFSDQPREQHSGVLTGDQFQDLIRDAKLGFTEYDIDLIATYAIKGSKRQSSAEGNVQINPRNDLIQFFSFEKAIKPVLKQLRKEDEDFKRKQKEFDMFEDEMAKFRREVERREKEEKAKQERGIDQLQKAREQQLINKIIEVFVDREITFFDCFQQHYDPLNPNKSIITISVFKKAIRTLNLPLTVQEHRILRRIADPQSIGKVDLQKFCTKFETEDLRLKRLNDILEKVATAFYLQNFNLRRAFALFDKDGDGTISKREFRQGWLTLNLGLTYDEIDDLMNLVDSDKSGAISYDEFISKMDLHIQKKTKQAEESSKEIIFHKIKALLDNNSETLYEIFKGYDYSNTDEILTVDLVRGFKKLGILHPEPHMKTLIEAGGFHEADEYVRISDFVTTFLNRIEKILGLNIKKNHELLQKVAAIIQAKKMSPFEFFSTLDVNYSGKISKIEYKTGLQSVGLEINNKEFDQLWKMIKKPNKKISIKKQDEILSSRRSRGSRASGRTDTDQDDIDNLSYYETLMAFQSAGCFKYQKSIDNTNNLVNKFRQQLKKKNISVEKAYKSFDPDDRKFVYKHDFVHECQMFGLEFNEEELQKIFEFICQVGSKGTESNDQQMQQIERKTQKATTRFTFKQLHDAVLVKRDENWIFQSYIKIHGVVLQKNLSYKRLFTQWREKNSKTQQGRLSQKELKLGLKKLRAGLTQDEIEKLCSSIPFEGKDNSIAAIEFERIVVQGAKKLEQEKSYEKLMIQEWISMFNEALEKEKIPIEKLFQEHDLDHKGALTFEEFALMNQFIGLPIPKKDLKRTFDIVDRSKSGKLRLEEIKSISNLIENEDDVVDDENAHLEGDALKMRQELDDLYEQVKERLEKKNATLENVIYDQLKYMPNQYANIKGIQQLFEKIQIILSKNEAEKVKKDIENYYNGRTDCSFKDLIDFMTRKRINVAFFDKGFVDPLIAQCCQLLNKTINAYDLTIEKVFDVFDRDRNGQLGRDTFIKCMQGMELGIAIEDLIEFFNFIDDRNENVISKLQFSDAITFVVNKIGGGSKLEQALSAGVSQTKKGYSIKQQVFNILQKLADAIQTKRLTMRQVIGYFDQTRTGFIARSEFALAIKSFEGGITLDESRLLMNFFDDKNTGKLSVIDLVKALQEIMNNQTGGGIYAFMQVQPILQKIINELAIDSDKFFDEVADLNEQILEEEQRQLLQTMGIKQRMKKQSRAQLVGLSKRLFYSHLQKYGVQLDEDEKTLLNTVFSLQDSLDKFDYEKLDSAFEGVQQQLYAQEWQRRIFKKIGEYLRKNNLTIHKCFNLIDEDNSQSVSIDELRNAIIRFQIDISDKELKVFLDKLDEDNKGYVTQSQFIKKFWSAYTYEDVFNQSEEAVLAKQQSYSGPKAGGLSDRIKRIRMFSAIQKKIKMIANAQDAFKLLDKGIGLLTLKDFQNALPEHFDITLKREEVLKLFKEIDKDKDGLVKYKEFEQFFNQDYDARLKEIEKEKNQASMQYEIFDHLIKVLQQKSLTLAEVFDQIDTNQNGFIEVDEFQNLLERLGFTISEVQIFELMRQMDENFDGRISYKELRNHIKGMGFVLEDDKNQDMIVKRTGKKIETFTWRDKGIEVVIRSLNSHLNKKPIEEFFKKFDGDHDNYLTPMEFRQALLSIKDSQLKKFQIERIMHILVNEKKSIPVISINKIAKFLKNYQYIDKDNIQKGQTTAILIDEDLFVYIVEKYDGFSRLVELTSQFEEKSSYLQRHVFEINLRGLNMLSNQKTVEKLHKKAIKLNALFESSLILLAGEATRLMKEEAQLCVLDPQFNINTIVNDQNAGVLASIQVPTIENSAFDIDFTTLTFLPSGAQRYVGVMTENKKRVEVLIFPNDDLNYVSADGKTYKKHLQMELQVHRFLMGAQFEDEEGLDPEKMEVFPNVGKFEKKIGLAASDKEIYVVNELIDEEQWISLEEFVDRNGGILNIPLFYHTDAPLFIIRYWAQKVLQIIQKLHEVGIVLRSMNLKQVFISRDGQRMKVGNLRGVGKVNNLGNMQTCPDIYLTLDNNTMEDRYGQSSTMSPAFNVGTSSKKTEAQKSFSNRALDSPFLAPEILFQKFSEHTSALDVWSFGMLMYCVLLGKKPESFYAVYRRWYKKQHGYDIELSSLPFIPPSQSNFLYDPFSVDFDNPFNVEEFELTKDLNLPGSLMEKVGSVNFDNVMKCIKNLSCSSLFENQNSKKFAFKSLAQDIKENNNPTMEKDQPPRFPGQSHSNQELRRKIFQSFAKVEILDRKNELGLILDLIASCLDMDAKKRPTIQGLLNSPLFKLDKYEMTNAVRFSQNVILYRSPQSSVSLKITAPLRAMCAIAIKFPQELFNIEADILKLFVWTEECIGHISSLPIDQINSVLTENEKRKSLIGSKINTQFEGKDYTQLRVSPNSPLAAQIIEDKVMDMLIFLTLRYTKVFNEWKTKKLTEIGKETQSILKQSKSMSVSSKKKSVKFDQDDYTERASQYQSLNQQNLQKKQTERLQNQIIARLVNILRTLVYEMHSYSTPMAPYVKEVIEYIVKFYVGEEYELGSDFVLRKTSGLDSTMKDYLRGRSFFRREADLMDKFKSDNTDKHWHTEQKNKTFLDKSNYWNLELHQEALRIYKDAITESGMGQSCYPVINDYITNITNSFEPSKVFSRQMNQLCLSFLIPMNRTAQYYNELIPLTECLARLASPQLEKAGKRCALAVIRSVFQTGSSDKIKACLDMRVPKHIIHFLQDTDSEVRQECLLIFYEMSKGLQDDDFEILGKSAANLKQELSKRAYKKNAFDQHKTLSLVSQQQEVLNDELKDDENSNKKRRGQPQQSQTDMMSNYIKRTTALIEKNDNEKFINFAMDLPNLNFLSNKRFLREMAICFESPVFIAPLIRLLKSPTESFQNKDTILQILANLFCGNEKVMIAVNSPACDTYMTLLRMLMQNTKIQSAKNSLSGLSAQMRQQLMLQEKVVELFRYMFEQRRPTIIRDISCIGAASTLLKEQDLIIPNLINLPEIVSFVDEFNSLPQITANMIVIEDFLNMLKDLRCWIKHFYNESQIPELTRIKALQRCMNLIIKVIRVLWADFPNSPDKRADYLILIKAGLQLIDWLCVRGQEQFIFNEQNGKYNIEFIIEKCNYALSSFRHPAESSRVPMEELTHNTKTNKEIQKTRKYDMFPFTEIGAILQNILYQLVRKNDPYTNQLLSEVDFGFVFGEQLILEYDFIRHCIDNKIESMVLIDTYVKKNEIRLNTFEYLLNSNEHTLKDQFIKSNFIEKLFSDYINDFREFNIQFSKIDLEFLAFRKTFPIRLEAISIINTTLIQKQRAPNVFTEVIMYARRHFLIRNEVTLIRQGKLTNQEQTSLLMFSIILESNEEDLIYAMMQEGAHKTIRDMMKEYPSLNKRFPILAAFTNKF